MIRENAACYVRGTAAIKYHVSHHGGNHARQSRMRDFDSIRVVSRPERRTTRRPETLRDRFWRLIASSEMACSLLTEDVRGCAYNKFSSADVAVCASVVSFISLISIFVGA